MRRNTLASLVLALALGLWLTGCEDTKARQENEQLKTKVAQLEKDNADLGNRVDSLTKDNATLAEENARLKAKAAPAKKGSKSKKKKSSRRARTQS
jgi:outer membrane murein-binding lipoprotein Lpp